MNQFLVVLTLSAACSLAAKPSDAQWVKANGIGGALVTSFASNVNGIFAGTNGGVIRSTDDGITWAGVNTGLTDSDIAALVADGPNVIAGTTNGSLFLLNGSGTTWKTVGQIGSYIHFATDGPLLFALSAQGLAFSGDLGATWQFNATAFGTNNPQALASISTLLFAGTSRGILFSLDFGASWQKLADTLLLNADVLSLVAQGNTLFAGTAYNGNSDTAFGGIFRSTDYGDTWSRVYNDLSIQVFAFSTNGTNIFAATDQGVLRSTDSGSTWNFSNVGLTNKNVRAVISYGDALFAGMLWDGVFRSMDGGATWAAGNVGLTGISPLQLCRTGHALFALAGFYSGGIQAGLLESTDEAETWTTKNPDSITNIQAFADFGGRYFAAIKKSYAGFTQILTLTDSTPWTFSTSIDSPFDNITFDTFGSNITLGTEDGGVFLSRDTGLTWEPADSGLGSWPSVYHIAAIGDTLFAGTYSGGYRSLDGGNVWTQMANGLPDSSLFCFAVIGNYLFAGDDGGKGLFRSTDDGESWVSISSGIPDGFSTLAFATSGTNLFAGGLASNGAGGRIFLTTDLGNSWTDVSIPGDGIVESLATDSQNLFATLDYGTNSSTGVWRRSLSEMIPQSSVAPVPAIPSAMQIFPNPCTQSATISFSRASPGYAKISIVNVLGIEVGTLFSGELDSWMHSFTWNRPTGLPDGIYEVVLSTPVNRSVARLAIAR